MRRFDACALCLQRARDPVACQEGHLFCKECAYTDLREFSEPSYPRFRVGQTRPVAQKKDIKRQKERLEALKKEAEQEKSKAKEAARERVLADFEKGQLGLAAVAAVTTSSSEVAGDGNFILSFATVRLIISLCQGAGPSASSHSIPQRRKRSRRRPKRRRYVKSSVSRLLPCAASYRTFGCLR